MRTYGSGQTNGAPLNVTANELSAAQTLHTAPSGSNTPNRIIVTATGIHSGALHVVLYSSGGSLIQTFNIFPGLSVPTVLPEMVLNGGQVLKVWADNPTTDMYVSASVDDQGSVAGILSQNLASGLIAAVQNASRFGVGTMGGTGQATRTNAEIVMARAGTIRNLYAVADTTIGGGCTVTVAVFVNGVSALSLAFTATDTTVGKAGTSAVAVNKGDKVTFSIACSNDGAPAANMAAAAEFV